MNKGNTNNKTQSAPYSKANYILLEQERNLLKITLDYFIKENQNLKHQLEDMKMTVKHNKELLKEYVERITNKDKLFEKMNAQIEHLTTRLHTLEEFNKAGNKSKVGSCLKKENKYAQTSTKLNANKVNQLNIVTETNLASTQSSTNNNINNTVNNDYVVVKDDYNKLSEFYHKQNQLLEEVNALKDDMKFILENKTKSKLKRTLEQSLNNSINLNSSYINDNSFNDLGASLLNNSVVSNISMSALKKKVNLKENFEMNEKFDSKFNEFLASFHPLRNILFFVDSKQTVWELVRRKDLSPSTLANKPEGIRSILSELNATNKFLAVDAEIHSPKSKLVNIEIKDIDHDRSLIASELDFSKVTDFNISMYMKEQQDIDIV